MTRTEALDFAKERVENHFGRDDFDTLIEVISILNEIIREEASKPDYDRIKCDNWNEFIESVGG